MNGHDTNMTVREDEQVELGTIRKTMDYSKFMYMGGNRQIDLKHVKELEAQMQRNHSMFASLPILINENWYIVDGQHRFEAAKNLGLPIYYVMQKGVDLADTRQLNIAQKRWGLKDFAQSYADSGRQDYVDLLRIKKQFPRISFSIVVEYLAGTRAGGGGDDRFRRGEFQIRDKEDSISCLEILTEVVELHGRPATNAFAWALWRLLHNEDFDEQVFLRKLREAPDTLNMATSTRASIRGIEDVYNRHNKLPVRLY